VTPHRVSRIDPPTFAGATVITGHPPAKDSIAKLRGEAHYGRDEATRVAAPRRTTGDGTARSGSDRCVVPTSNEAATSCKDVLKLPVEVTKFQHAAVKAAL
jgi:hypothetical protein